MVSFLATTATIASKAMFNSESKALTRLKAYKKTMANTTITAIIHIAIASKFTHFQKKKGINAGDVNWRLGVKSFGDTYMEPTSIIMCHRCGGLFLTKDNQKTRTCPYCSTCNDVQKAKKIASAKNAFEASQILRKLKSRKGFNR